VNCVASHEDFYSRFRARCPDSVVQRAYESHTTGTGTERALRLLFRRLLLDKENRHEAWHVAALVVSLLPLIAVPYWAAVPEIGSRGAELRAHGPPQSFLSQPPVLHSNSRHRRHATCAMLIVSRMRNAHATFCRRT
jgi:hypothetical protein